MIEKENEPLFGYYSLQKDSHYANIKQTYIQLFWFLQVYIFLFFKTNSLETLERTHGLIDNRSPETSKWIPPKALWI